MIARAKKTVVAAERDEVARQDWRDVAVTLPARRVTVIDESGTHLDMTSRYGRAPRGARAYASQRRNTGKNMTLLAGITLDGMTAPFVIEGSVTTAVLETYFRAVLCPTLHPGDIVILDNLSAHHAPAVIQILIDYGCQVLFLPAYSPDFSPIENAFAKIKDILRRLRAQTVDALLDAIAEAIQSITPWDAIGYFTNAGLLNLD